MSELAEPLTAGQTRPRTRLTDLLDFERIVCGGRHIGESPALTDPETLILRVRLIAEEFTELIVAIGNLDLPGIARELVDLAYVVEGTGVALGIDMDSVWNEVHEANMAKAGGPVRGDGKPLKPEGWQPPDIAGVLFTQPSIKDI